MTLPMGVAQREVFGRVVAALADDDPRIVVVDGDVASSTKADIVEKAHPDRFLEMGIAEQNMLGVAAGLATTGLIPFVSTFVAFAVVRPLDQVRVLIAQTGANVKITPSYAGLFTGSTGMSHIIVDDLAIMRDMPGMVVIAPADDVEAEGALRWAAQYEGPVYVRLVRDATPRVFEPGRPFEIGTVAVLREGSDVSLLSTGTQTPRVLQAADLLAEQGVDARVVHVPTLKPLDVDGIVDAASTGRVITIEEHSVLGGLGGAVAEVLSEHRPTRLDRLGFQDVYPESGTNDDLLDLYGLTPAKVAAQVAERLRR
ncbi:transketolase C-terminal domain-containing protein [Isoptericola sp. b441]|uniref:Transketolase C-terminal domain-containing protein n=2 Tax=Actinotalea lenta TaxID=3064654 RepID=A0ABT9DF38_9CELL|nr:transketolase C-terminal domain-containing protein [Isoptericola sp. b441]MDO8108373.1 transketolase C-terminal domain-containing protein [Isoptericola sp. b441]MDO8119791.1 transketolase C-terminal domain-containing protein [Isoptericola sp. b490]